jgi:hypothetical protein
MTSRSDLANDARPLIAALRRDLETTTAIAIDIQVYWVTLEEEADREAAEDYRKFQAAEAVSAFGRTYLDRLLPVGWHDVLLWSGSEPVMCAGADCASLMLPSVDPASASCQTQLSGPDPLLLIANGLELLLCHPQRANHLSELGGASTHIIMGQPDSR